MTTSDPARYVQALLRQHLASYAEKVFRTLEPGTPYMHNWHIDHLCWHLTRVARGEVRRLIITIPPRSMKSLLVSVAFPSWLMGHDPTQRIICVSYADDFARKLALDTRTIVEEPWYRAMFPDFVLRSQRPRTSDLLTTQGGYRYASGLNGAILGRGAGLIIVDDPIKATDVLSAAHRNRVNQTFDNTISTRLNNKVEGAIVIIMQRLHEDDLVGHVLTTGDWEVVSIPAIETEDRYYQLGDDPSQTYYRRSGEVLHADREPQYVLEQLRRSQGSLTFSAQYQQSPVPPTGNIVKREWLRCYDSPPNEFDLVVASWDTASTISDNADYSVGTVWGAKGLDFYLLDVTRGRYEFHTLKERVLALADRWDVDQTIIEKGDIGRVLVRDLRQHGNPSVILKSVRFDKEARFVAQSARFESGQVYVPSDAPWLAVWLNELLAFPNGRHDDQVDSTSQALDYLTERTKWRHPRTHRRTNGTARARPRRRLREN